MTRQLVRVSVHDSTGVATEGPAPQSVMQHEPTTNLLGIVRR